MHKAQKSNLESLNKRSAGEFSQFDCIVPLVLRTWLARSLCYDRCQKAFKSQCLSFIIKYSEKQNTVAMTGAYYTVIVFYRYLLQYMQLKASWLSWTCFTKTVDSWGVSRNLLARAPPSLVSVTFPEHVRIRVTIVKMKGREIAWQVAFYLKGASSRNQISKANANSPSKSHSTLR